MSADREEPLVPRRGGGTPIDLAALAPARNRDADRGSGTKPIAANDQPAIARGGNGRFAKGKPSPNPDGRPPEPDMGPWTERMNRKRTVSVGGKLRTMTDREYLDTVIARKAIACDPAALKLRDARARLDGAEERVRERLRKERERMAAERRLGISNGADLEEMARDSRRRELTWRLFEKLTGNAPALKDRLIAWGAISFNEGALSLADWLEPPQAPPR